MQELLEELPALEWPEQVKAMQRNWIGRSDGAVFDFPVAAPASTSTADDSSCVVRVFTTRADTIFGATYALLSFLYLTFE